MYQKSRLKSFLGGLVIGAIVGIIATGIVFLFIIGHLITTGVIA